MCFKRYSDQPTKPMPAPAPEVKHYSGLAEFQSLYADSVIVAFDLEAIDHRNGIYAAGLENWEKVSEVGSSFFDPRDLRLNHCYTSATISGPSSTEGLSTISKSIVSHHTIIHRWRNFTEETCYAPYHRTHEKPHTAMPYHCIVAESQIKTQNEALSDLDRLLHDLSVRNLTTEEIEAGKRRTVRIIYWDARMESNWFHDMEFDVTRYGAIEWDYQKFKPFRSRFEKAKTGAGKAFDSLGALGAGAGGMAVLHNAANDTFTQVVAFLRFMVMTEAEWKNWRGRSDYTPGDLDPEPEPVIVHHSAMAEIEAGVTFTTVSSAMELRSWADVLRKPAEKIINPTSPWSPTTSWSFTSWNSFSWESWEWKSTTGW